MNHYGELRKELIKLRENLVIDFINMPRKDRIDAAVLFQEIEDVTNLLINEINEDLIENTLNFTTSGELYDLLLKYRKEESV